FPTTTNGAARNNLADAPIHLRDTATATLSGNLVTATPAMFLNAGAADLHLVQSATNAIDKATVIAGLTNDFDGERRPRGGAPDIGGDEFNANTRPLITGLSLSGTNSALTFTTLLGLSYDVQWASDLMGAWASVVSNLPGTGAAVQATDTNGAG